MGKRHKDTLDVDSPVGNADVTPGYPGACNGTVACSGTAQRDPTVWQLCRILVRVAPSNIPMTIDDIKSSGYQINTWDPTAGEWHPANSHWEAQVGGARCQGGGACQEGGNNVGVVAEWRRIGTMDIEDDAHIHSFTGLCARHHEVAAAKNSKKSLAKRAKAGTVLKYKNVSPQQSGFGYRLNLRNGDALRASKIAIYAHKVAWSPYGERTESVFRPAGNRSTPAAPFRFRNLPEHCIALLQVGTAGNGARLVRAIGAESQKDADVFEVHPDQDLFIRVNDLPSPAVHTGSFHLWVKVLVPA